MLTKLVRLLSSMQQYGVICTPSQMDDRCVHTREVHNVEIARRLIEEGVTVHKWIPVSERLPDKDGLYLVSTKHNVSCEYYHIPKYVEASFGLNDNKHAKITHWMPLPDPPKEVNTNGSNRNS